MGDDPAPSSAWSAVSAGQCGFVEVSIIMQHDGTPREHGRAKVLEGSTLMLVDNPQHQPSESRS